MTGLFPIGPYLAPFVIDPPPRALIGRPRKPEGARTTLERVRKHRAARGAVRIQDIAILDFETDQFDNTQPERKIAPFAACLYSDQFAPIIIWEDNLDDFIAAVLGEIGRLPRRFTIYAHNGGKFDYMFLVSKLRGVLKFKGRAIMSARIGNHELRDSLHIIPTKLANIEKKDFDYSKLDKSIRKHHKDYIIDYMVSDCTNLFPIVRKFVNEHGLKISIGQAAMAVIKKHYTVGRLIERTDRELRPFFFGGRVECFMGAGHFIGGPRGPYQHKDANSMYPWAMKFFKHPIASQYIFRSGQPTEHTYFIDLECNSRGALVTRGADGCSATYGRGRFQTTIWEYNMARELDLISDIDIYRCVDCLETTDFSKFVDPFYDRRMLETKPEMERLRNLGQMDTEHYRETERDDWISKFLLNNGFGKFAQNPRKFCDYCITEPDELPDGKGWMEFPVYECDLYWIWKRPNTKFRFNNVGTAASITGAARAELMRAIYHAVDPIYADTDGIICRELPGFIPNETALGAWKTEAEYSEVLIAGKKKYAAKPVDYVDGGKKKLKFRWAGAADLTWDEVEQILLEHAIVKRAKAPTITRDGRQFYMKRTAKRTAPIITSREHPFWRIAA